MILNLTDTFSSTANLNVEETDQIVINIGNLTQSANFAGRYPGGLIRLVPVLTDLHLVLLADRYANDTFRIQTNLITVLIYFTHKALMSTRRELTSISRVIYNLTLY